MSAPGDTTETREPMLETARETLVMVNEILLPNDDQAMRHQLAVTAQAEATLAVAEEIRALREQFGLTGRAGTVGDQIMLAVGNVQGAVVDAAQTVADQAMRRR